jgi:kynurenine formamidase
VTATNRLDQLSVADFDALFEELDNSGRWGPEDGLGTLNLLTPAHVAAAAATVRSGRTVTLALPINTVAGPDNPAPAIHRMTIGHDDVIGDGDGRFATDFVGIEFHGESQSHVDALAHVSYRGVLYNGQPVATVRTSGATVLSVDDYRHGIVGRGVLIDAARYRDVPWLRPGEYVTGEELEAAARAQRVDLRAGDVLLFRTGQHRRRLEEGPWDNNVEGRAGLHPTALRLLAARNVAAFGCDGDGETIPSPVEGITYPIHPLMITAMGMAAFDNLQLEDLRQLADEEQRQEFLFVAGPLRLLRGTGSPVNPTAIF